MERFSERILEPACGNGCISEVLKSFGYSVVSRDLIDRGYGEGGRDFLSESESFDGDIVTNPPYKYAIEFVEKSLSLVGERHKVAMFLKLLFLEGKGRREFFKHNPPARVYVASGRFNCALNGDFVKEGAEGGSVAYAWFVWEKGFDGDPVIKWFH